MTELEIKGSMATQGSIEEIERTGVKSAAKDFRPL
jgi:hypothetical protein